MGKDDWGDVSSARGVRRRVRRCVDAVDVRQVDGARGGDARVRPIDGKSASAVAFEVPENWVRAIDRPFDARAPANGATIAMVGDFKSVDTVSVRAERAPAGARDAKDANALAEALTANERAAVEALESFGVIGGVENGRSGTMAFELDGDARARTDADSGRTYYEFGYTTEVCRATIEEGAGGDKICVGPKGDLLESIKRRSRVVVTSRRRRELHGRCSRRRR